MLTIQLQRQGVSHSLRANFGKCPHGHSWHIELQDYQGRCTHGILSYPNCIQCFPPLYTGPAIGSLDFLRLSAKEQHNLKLEYMNKSRHGQVAWSNGKDVPAKNPTLACAKNQVLSGIERVTGLTCEFSPSIEAYMYYNESTLRAWPYLATDVFVTTACYDPAAGVIRHAATGAPLFAFEKPYSTAGAPAISAHRELCAKAYQEFLKPHNQRQSERDARGWMAWLIGEWIKDFSSETPVTLPSIVREGVSA